MVHSDWRIIALDWSRHAPLPKQVDIFSQEAIAVIAAGRGVGLEVQQTQALGASLCDPGLTDRLAAAVAATGQEPRRMVSGAGHDAMIMAALAPTAMLFIRCAGGVSHNPLEDVAVEDAELAVEAMLRFIEGLSP